jgi:hypothetical protein
MEDKAARGRLGILSFLSLFTSFSTLLCCALPALLVSLGMGVTVASLLSAMPWIASLSHYKTWIFISGGLFLSCGFFMAYGRNLNKECDETTACAPAGRFTRFVLWLSLVLYAVGFFMAFLYLPIVLFFES